MALCSILIFEFIFIIQSVGARSFAYMIFVPSKFGYIDLDTRWAVCLLPSFMYTVSKFKVQTFTKSIIIMIYYFPPQYRFMNRNDLFKLRQQ